MRIRTITGLTLAGFAAAAAAAVAGGAAYAGAEDTAPVGRFVTGNDSARTVTQDEGTRGSTPPWDCPENGGSDSGESGAPTTPDQPATPNQPAIPAESL